MKRLVWILAGLVGLASPALAAYDGPPVLPTYDHTINGIHLVLTAQQNVLNGGRSRFTATIEVPIEAHNVGRNVTLQIWRYTGGPPPPDVLVDDSCSRTSVAADVGTTVTFQCEIFGQVPGSFLNGSTITVYPKVVRNSTNPVLITEHNGLPYPLSLTVVGDDALEPNNSLVNPRTVTVSAATPYTQTDLVLGLNSDFYRFVAPAGVTTADVSIDFWNSANDLELRAYDAAGSDPPLAEAVTGNDGERVIFSVTPGQAYLLAIEPSQETHPAFYDFTIAFANGPHTITGTPSGSPNPIASEGTATFNANAVDSFGHALTYDWSHTCSGISLGTWTSSRTIATPTWTAPKNTTGTPKVCTVTVRITDGITAPVQKQFQEVIDPQGVNPPPHGLTISSAPGGSPNPTPAGTAVALHVTATDTLSHSIAYQWTASCPTLASSGSFSPSAAVQNPTWTAPANSLATQQDCTLSVTANDGSGGLTASANYTQGVLSEAAMTYTYYFAEGATIGGFFATRFALLNADPNEMATAVLNFQLKDTATVLTYNLNIPAHTRATVDAGTLGFDHPLLAQMASAEFSTVIRSNRPLVADRTMTWDSRGYGSDAETSVSSPASVWYLAEGATIGDFELYYLIQNPNSEALNNEIEVTYLLPPPAAPIVRYYSMGANTRTNIAVHFEPGLENVEVSAIIRTPAQKPVIVERAMYLTAGGLFYGAGHESAGIRAPETQWFFAEGATGGFFDLFILIGNPNDVTANITATFLFDDGTTCTTQAPVGPKSRYNIWVDATVIPGCRRSLADAAVSTTINSDIPVVAERTMWWPGPTAANWAEAHNAAGAPTTGIRWGLADGEQGGLRANETYILIANTSAYAGTARVTLYFDDGATLQKDVPLTANSRTNVAVGAGTDAGGFGDAVKNKKFGAIVESVPVAGQDGPAQIVVERAMYSNGPGAPFWAAGTDVLATKLQ